MRDTGHDGREQRRIDGAEGLGPDQFRNQEGMVDANQARPLAVGGELCRGVEIAEALEDIDALLKPVPQAGLERLNRFHVPLDFLADP